MNADDALCGTLGALLESARPALPINHLAVLRQDGGDVVLTHADVVAITTFRLPIAEIPEALRPGAPGIRTLMLEQLEANVGGLVETILLRERLTNEIREVHSVRQALVCPLDDGTAAATLLAGTYDIRPFSTEQVSQLEIMARQVATVMSQDEAPDAELERLRRLGAVDGILPSLFQVLDVREIFERLSVATKDVLPHDALALAMFSDDRTQIERYAHASANRLPDVTPNPYPSVIIEHFRSNVVNDLTLHPIERDQPHTRAGVRSSMRMAIRLEPDLRGVLSFFSRERARFTPSDLAIGRRIAEYVGLAVAHQRLDQQARRTAALRERTANLEMLDGLLETLTDVLDIREVFGRVSEISSTIMTHDAMSIAVPTDDREHLKVYVATGALSHLQPPFEIAAPDTRLLKEHWDYELVDDMTAHPLFADVPSTRSGMRSVLAIPVWVEGALAASVNFYSAATAHFSRDDVLVGRRIADHVALALSHQRLAEAARRSEELRATAARSDLLDELLHSVTDTGELPEVFERISNASQRVLSHDALVLTAILPGGTHARVYASKTPPHATFPEIVAVPPLMVANPEWEYQVVDDLQEQAEQQQLEATKRGYRSALRVPIRLEGEYAAGLSFLSFTPNRYTVAEVPIARRIADRISLSFARERGRALSRRADDASARAAQLESRVQTLTDELNARAGFHRVIGESPAWRQILTQATQVGVTETTVLLLGESGTGKEVVARFIHRASPRAEGPFVALNCAALPEQLLEAELFGYERGAFTGAMHSKPGQLEQAARGTLFLDEVGEMSPSAQAKFLRVLQEREFQRLGGTKLLKADTRIVAATNRDLENAMERGQFREDLFYRLNVFAIRLPALRDRRDDIPRLSQAFVEDLGRTLGTPPAGISRDARRALIEYHWPGNVRELRNILERAAILADGGLIASEHLAFQTVAGGAAVPAPPLVAAPSAAVVEDEPASGGLHAAERVLIERALADARFNKSAAAKKLGLTRAQLYARLRRLGLE
jgi:transcriptional regulator with GAF, ATPase, and Fis domain